MDNIVIGERILRLRKDRELTQAQLAALINVSPQAVSKWENGDAMPDIEMLVTLAHTFGVSIDSLVLDKVIDNKVDVGESEVCSDALENDVDETSETMDIPHDNNDNGETKSEEKADSNKDEHVGDSSNVIDKHDDNVLKMARLRLGTVKTLSWSVLATPIICMAILLSLGITAAVLLHEPLVELVGGQVMPAIFTEIGLLIIWTLLLINYILFKAGLRYRIFFNGDKPQSYPRNGAEWFGLGFKKLLLWFSRYFIAIKMYIDGRKNIKKEIAELDAVIERSKRKSAEAGERETINIHDQD